MNNSERKLKTNLRIAGAILWLLVFAYLVYFYIQKEKRSTDSPPEIPTVKLPTVKLPTGSAPKFQPYDIPDFKLIDQNGNEVAKKDLAGRPWVVSFIFTRCRDGCPQVVESLQKLKTDLGNLNVGFLSISVDPKYDTVEVLKHYADALTVKSDRWIFLTGPPEEISTILGKNGFRISAMENSGDARKPGYEVTHSQSLLYLDPSGKVVGKFNGIDPGGRAQFERRIRNDLKKRQE